MPRAPRIVVPGAPHHVTQRGNRRQQTFFGPADYLAYLKIAVEEFSAAGVSVWAYCLMPNHVHLIAAPEQEQALAAAVGSTHLRYTRYVNQRQGWTGHLWQGRFSSFPMDETYLRACVRYVGLNPVRAGLARNAADWPWSSVRGHLQMRTDPLITPEPIQDRLGLELAQFFTTDVDEAALRVFRRVSSSGRPLGTDDWVKAVSRR